MDRSDNLKRYGEAARLLPPKLRAAADTLGERERLAAEEFRLRAGRPLTVLMNGSERPLGNFAVTPDDITSLLAEASYGSLHTVTESMKKGFITASGGHRIGVCGTAIVKNGEIGGMKDMSSASLRIAKQFKGVAAETFERLRLTEKVPNILIVSPPGAGKTTFLRDLVRLISDGGRRVSVADERGEIAALRDGEPGFDVGTHTDVLEGCAKAEAVLILLRAMNPEVVALDEITDPADIAAIRNAANCGVSLLATVHAWDEHDLGRREYGEQLRKLFDTRIYIERVGQSRIYRTERGENDA